MQTKNHQPNLTRKVQQAILHIPGACEDERILFFAICEQLGFKLTVAQREIITQLPKPSSIARIRHRLKKIYEK